LQWTTIKLPNDIGLLAADRRRVFNEIASGSYIGTKAAINYLDLNFIDLRSA